MERGFVGLSLDDEEEEVVQVQRESDLVSAEEDFCLMGAKSSSNEELVGREAFFEKEEESFSFIQGLIHIGLKLMSKRVFRFKRWWVKEENCADEVRRLWQSGRGNILEKLKVLQSGLMR
ncbi:hypothetical protein PVK06_026465 [Gossypium arboreum]|uniref:Uncharacterized protein n=1 Tax=Gossypium arboreum TaxID=29729 RepID=A0ABR0NY32_GOSAR|nr:hypothetical protein PVK06_026465 [Gossypium arboreum]